MTDTKAMATHTPGPWSFGGPVSRRSFTKYPSVGDPLWEVGPERGSVTPKPMAFDGIAAVRSEADARLIAAAPDMNGALEWFLEETRGSISDVEAQRVVGRMRGIATLALGLARGGRS